LSFILFVSLDQGHKLGPHLILDRRYVTPIRDRGHAARLGSCPKINKLSGASTSDKYSGNISEHHSMEEPFLDVARHIKYWERCLKTALPNPYTSTDSSRMTLGFFILSALDLLGASATSISEKERKDIRDWVLKCQHPNGGFCGSTNHRYPDAYYVDIGHGRELMDPPNLPATFFAILNLSYVGDLRQVKKAECLSWLRSLQREDGSFGEFITKDRKIKGGKDMRYCMVAMSIRWMLRGDDDSNPQVEDIDVEKLVDYIRSAQVGFGQDA